MKTLLEGKKKGGKKPRDMKSKNGRRWIRGEPKQKKYTRRNNKNNS